MFLSRNSGRRPRARFFFLPPQRFPGCIIRQHHGGVLCTIPGEEIFCWHSFFPPQFFSARRIPRKPRRSPPLRPWAGTVGITSPEKLTTPPSARRPTLWFPQECATPDTATSI